MSNLVNGIYIYVLRRQGFISLLNGICNERQYDYVIIGRKYAPGFGADHIWFLK